MNKQTRRMIAGLKAEHEGNWLYNPQDCRFHLCSEIEEMPDGTVRFKSLGSIDKSLFYQDKGAFRAAVSAVVVGP